MCTNRPLSRNSMIDPRFLEAISAWKPEGESLVLVEVEPWAEGLRVKLSYLGVETGVLFCWGTRVSRPAVHGSLNQLFEVLSWRVTQPPTGFFSESSRAVISRRGASGVLRDEGCRA